MTAMRKIVPEEAFDAVAVEWILQKIELVLQQAPQCHLMLAGGGTPLPVYERLAERDDVPWQRQAVYFGNERCVEPTSTENHAFTVVTRVFREGVPQGLVLHRMCGEEDRDRAARDYEGILPQRIDILLLGVGEDGHTASLFPGSVALDEKQRRIMPVIGSKAPRQRLTITPPVIRDARYLLVMARGEDKSDAVRRALQEGNVPAA